MLSPRRTNKAASAAALQRLDWWRRWLATSVHFVIRTAVIPNSAVAGHIYPQYPFHAIIAAMSILIAEDNVAQRHYLREILEKEFPAHAPVVEAADGEETIKLALDGKPDVCILDIQMPKLSGVKAARAIWRDFPTARIIFWTQFPHEIYINEIRKIVKSVDPPPAYGFIHKKIGRAHV